MTTNLRFQTSTGGKYGFSASGRISPYFEGVERAGGTGYRNHGATYVPWKYPETPEEQYEAVTKRVTLWDTATEQQLQVKGDDARKFVDQLITRDLTKIRAGRCAYTFICDETGTVMCDPVLMILDDETIWMSQSKSDLFFWAKAHALHSNLDVEISLPEVAPLQVQGPRSRDTMRKICEYPIDQMKFFDCVKTRVAGCEAVVSRTGWTGELGYEIYPIGIGTYPGGAEKGMKLWNAILEAGEEYGILVTQFLWARAMESGITIFDGTDEDFSPLEFWRGNIADLSGGEYVGKKAIEKVAVAGGPPRKMVGLIAEDPDARIEVGEWELPLTQGDDVIGSTRRYAFSLALGKAISIARIDTAKATPGEKVTVWHPGGYTEMTVSALPFIDPEGKRVRM